MTKKKGKGKGRPKSAPTRRIIKGKGDYKTVLNNLTTKMDGLLKKIPKGAFSRGGGAVGNFVGGSMGAALGKRMGAGLSAITGYGDYQVRSNSLSTVSTSVDMVPQFARTDHSVRVCHREFVGDLKVPTSPDDFNNDFVELINPANPVLFPWLNKMALLYTQYKIHGMVITYKTMSSNYSASGGPLGTVIIATNYNVNDQAFVNKVQMENSEFAVSCNPSTSLIHAIECDPKVSGLQTLYILDPNTELTGATSDLRFYHYGKLQIATSGLPGAANTTMGEVWISYDIELMKPVIGASNATPVTPSVPGQAITSNPNGQISVQSTSRVVKSTITKGYTYPTGPNELKLYPDNDTDNYVAGDAGLWYDSNTNINGCVDFVPDVNDMGLALYKPGRYRVTTYGTIHGLSSGAIMTESVVNTMYNAVATIVGNGLTFTLQQVTPNFSLPHYGRDGDIQTYAAGQAYVNSPALLRLHQYTVTLIITVNGTNTNVNTSNYIRLLLPRLATTPSKIRVHTSNFEVEWLNTEARLIEPV